MATQTLAQVRAAVKAAHPTATTAAINATARKDYAADQQKAAAVATPTTAKAPTAAAPVTIVGPNAAQGVLAAGGAGNSSPWNTGAWTPASAGITTWGQVNPVAQSAPSGDTYALAQQYYAALTDPTARTGFFAQSQSNLQNQLNQLLTGIIGNGQAYYPVGAYGVIPDAVLKAANIAPAQLAAYQTQLVNGGVTIVQRPEQSTASLSGLAATTGAAITTVPAAQLGGGASSSQLPNPMVSSPITAGGPGTVYSTPVGSTGTAGAPAATGATAGGEGTTVSGGGSDAGSPAVGGAFGDLSSSTVAGFPLIDVLLIAGAGVGLWYVSKHRKKGGKK